MAQFKTGSDKLWKWVAGIFLVIVTISGSAALYFNAKWKPLLTKEIKKGILDASHQLYKIDFKDIHLNLLTGSATLDSVTLMPDSAVYEDLKRAKLAPAHLIQLNLKKLQFSRVGVLKAYFKKEIDMKALILDKPSINIIYHQVDKKADTVIDERTLFQQISKSLKSIRVHRIHIINADFDYINGDIERRQNAIKHLTVKVDDFLLDSLSHQDTTRIYYTREITFELSGYKSLSKDRMYTLRADTIIGSAKGRSLQIKGFYMLPMFTDLAFTRKYKTQKDRYKLHFRDITFKGINFVKLNQEGKLYAQSLILGPAKVAIFMNRELPPPKIDKGRNYPQMVLKRLSLPINLDTIKLKNIDVSYIEYNPISQKRGKVDFENLKGTLLNVTNDPMQLAKNNHAVAKVSTRIINAARININLDFNLTAKDGAFHYSGHIGPMNMTALNPLSQSLGLVKIEQGKVKQADFNIKGNLYGSSGTMRFEYEDLKIALLKEGEDGEPAKKKGLLSFLANTIVIKDKNPDEGEEVYVAKIAFERSPASSFFNLLWKSVFVGIRETIGIGMVPIKSPEKAYGKVADKKQERQEKRKKKKEARIKEKAAAAREKIR
jgi:hypothetical protein